ncbi:hypothetical protein [Nostoc sp. UHCC 0251]|uniref:hypothetical protein n=1 Tax=Nostoc sp. UHCC 0251 TaxID=3110240 RepID=UPI002B200A37|nr:hypothetical protein [Nostoc sp. UHCC 0251]MEA5621845.1 hypothetical protein [Nostoc sp. UHCC 0251]
MKYKTVIFRDAKFRISKKRQFLAQDFLIWIINIVAFQIKSLFKFLKAIATINPNPDGRLSKTLGKLNTGDLFEVNQPILIMRVRVISIF